jgi:hypothetical protein
MSDKLRLLICEHCGSVEEMPDYAGPWQSDTWLNEKLKNHLLPSGEKTHGNAHVARIDASDWMSHRQDIVAKMASEFTMPGQGAGFGQTYYDTKDNFSADAMQCWRVEHNRTTNCGDYKSDKKRLLPDTRAERKELGLDPRTRPNTFLCDFCPYNSIVMQRRASEEFKYNYDV